MVTIKDVAREASVSIATVSMVINGKSGITEQTKKKVWQTVKRLNYVPNKAAKSLKTNRSNNIAVFISDITNPFFPTIIKGIETLAAEESYNLSLFDFYNREDLLLDAIQRAVSQGADGLFITGVNTVTEEGLNSINKYVQSGVSVVSTNQYMESELFPLVTSNVKEPLLSLLYKLIALGHKKIACVTGPSSYWVCQSREHIYKEALEEFNLFDPDLIYRTSFDIEDASVFVESVLKENPQITAVFCVNDTIAVAVTVAARRIGLKIPDNLSLFGVDGIEMMTYLTPAITTVDTERFKHGYQGAKRLIDMIRDEKNDPSYLEVIEITGKIKQGQSLAAPETRNV